MSFPDVIRDVLHENGIFCDEMTQVGYVSWSGLPIYAPRTLITSGFSGTLGSGFPTALGVKVAMPDRPVVAVTGDGGFPARRLNSPPPCSSASICNGAVQQLILWQRAA